MRGWIIDRRSRNRVGAGAMAGLLAGAVVTGTAPAEPVLGAENGAAKVPVTWAVGLGAPADQAKARKKAINSVVKAFSKEHPDIKLSVKVEGGDVHDALGGRIADGKLPDVIGPTTLRELSFSDSFADLAPLAQAAGYDLGAFDPGLLRAYQDQDGRLVGLPFGAFPSIVCYNKDLFDEAGLAYPPTAVGDPYVMPDGTEAPWNLDTVREVARLLTVDANGTTRRARTSTRAPSSSTGSTTSTATCDAR